MLLIRYVWYYIVKRSDYEERRRQDGKLMIALVCVCVCV